MNLKKEWIVAVGIVSVLFGLMILQSCGTTQNTWVPRPGEEVHLATSSDNDVLVAVDGAARDALSKALGANDEYGYTELLLSGRVFPVTSGTRALVLDYPGFLRTEVRILSGPYAGRSGVVAIDFVKP